MLQTTWIGDCELMRVPGGERREELVEHEFTRRLVEACHGRCAVAVLVHANTTTTANNTSASYEH
jgi:hypothetical protein